MLAFVFVAELVAAAPLPARPLRDGPAPPSAARVDAHRIQVVVAGRIVSLIGLGDADSERLLSGVVANLGAAIDAVTAFWGTNWPHQISVVAAGSDQQFRIAAGGGAASQWVDIAAVTVVDHVDNTRRTATGQRIVFAPGAAGMSPAALRIVLTHELFHYAARMDTATDAPRWLTEGVADFVARPATSPVAEAVPAVLPSDADLGSAGPQRSLAYDRAWWFARFIAETYGTTVLRELYLAACGAGHPNFATAARAVLDTDPAGLLVRWQRWLTRLA
ncbi:hypothetical protein B1987_02515 [Mycobacterium kansasii]|uniref:DUF4157 domain-containing protein n=1 Tax=Mycobacterium attenuatum TaxID=2341086 RepID=A0A498Q1H5_9MYCO|nr:hypothetical protein [Mycobacterium attenuatum]ORB82894.1 hypothetical protein B1987_02515 [Mycobacterium kansasii]VBA39988.1 hypothetical protein LAUMK136_03272 [Mycobacterium attenuatum]VBA54964.1 hypothetical protein LAUMK191_03237 [Mycobacterium attenuatum]VBA59126.1 hypothetical protein LAUMK41_03330 [Mycobacterium attenuatum]